MKNYTHTEAVIVTLSNTTRPLSAGDLSAQLGISIKRVTGLLRQLLIADQVACVGMARNGVLTYRVSEVLREKQQAAKEEAFNTYKDPFKAGDAAVVASLDEVVA